MQLFALCRSGTRTACGDAQGGIGAGRAALQWVICRYDEGTASYALVCKSDNGLAKCSEHGWIVFQTPVLMVGPAVLRLVEPDETQQVIFLDSIEQVCYFAGSCDRSSCRLGDQDGIISKVPDGRNIGCNEAFKCIASMSVIAVQAHPIDIRTPRPPFVNRRGARQRAVDIPQPGDITYPISTEDVDNVLPSSNED